MTLNSVKLINSLHKKIIFIISSIRQVAALRGLGLKNK
ncbi:MAG: hypothetical protein ACJASU_001472 [Cognaticolwellia sp.]|jgi:hypothetical protein